MHDGKKDLLINDGSNDDPRELHADKYASEFLIPGKYDKAIKKFRSKAEIVDFANALNVAPGIMAGRYQFLTGRWDLFKGLIRSFQWAE